jgi:hypothetical protein
MTHEEIKEQLPLYVLGGLDPETATAIEQHVAEPCGSCSAEVREWQELVGLIPLGVAQPGPSAEVKERLLARVRQEAGGKVIPLRPRRWRAAWVAIPLAAAAALLVVIGNRLYQNALQLATNQTSRVETVTALLAQEQEKLAKRETELQRVSAQLGEQQRVTEEQVRQVAQLETVVTQQQSALAEQKQLVALREQELARLQNASAAGQQTQLASYEREISTLKTELEQQRTALEQQRLASTESERELRALRATVDQQRAIVDASVKETEQLRSALARQRGVIEVLTSPGLQVGYLQKAKLGVSTQGHVLWNERRKAWLFYAFGMPQAPEGKEYQVWFMTEKEGPVSAGLFTPDQAGTGMVLAAPPSRLFGKIVAAAVTLEPAGGLPKPSGDMYLRGSL